MSFDTWIQGLYQKFSEEVQLRFDKNCYWLAYCLTYVTTVLLAVSSFELIVGLTAEDSLVTAGFILLIYGWVFILDCWRMKQYKSFSQQHKPAAVRQNGQFTQFIRLFMLFFGVFYLFGSEPDVIASGLMLTWSSMFYFEACTPLPPGSRRYSRTAYT